MSAKERYEDLWERARKRLPDYKNVIREEQLKALTQVIEKPVLDLDDSSC